MKEILQNYNLASSLFYRSNSFSLDSPREFKRVHARQGGSRPDKYVAVYSSLLITTSLVESFLI